MQNFRKEKITNIIKELSATFIEKESSNNSIITVTRVVLTPDNKKATILITVLPKEKENAALNFIKRNLGEMRIYISSKLKIHPIPFLSVEIDQGEINRQKIDELLLKS
jgi:ribosome-binding factor A